ncbi:Hypothetical predicted protein [Mytilus galloprovincialis]|uniref:SUEL-type lectin domain-containing protein n=1 Tax=Mytilus galloprovincialis TaxID=29158 RepID=A0A8B6HA83_MYTGA|nr:Hypothetical predicted protein [Mytilus galloprovincialis]
MSSVVCGGKLRQIEIQSVELTPYLSFCEKPTLNNSCTELIHQKVETSCNGKKKCKQLIWDQSVSTWDDCIRIPQVFKISFSCIKAIQTELPLQDESNVVGTNEGKTVNDQESNSETRINGQIIRQYSNLATFSTALKPSDAGCPVQHLNAHNYEMAKPINDSKEYDKNITIAENDYYAFNEDQYDIAGKIDISDYQQGIYSRAVDTVYASTSHSRQNHMAVETYDHAFG